MGSTRRPSLSGRRELRRRMCRQARRKRSPACSRWSRRRSSRIKSGTAFHRHTLLPLDDCLYALQATISGLPRPSLHRCSANGMASPGCPASRASIPPSGSSGPIRSASLKSRRSPAQPHRRGSHQGGQAAPVRRYRPHDQVRLHRAAREGHHQGVRGSPPPPVEAVPYEVHTVLTDNDIHFNKFFHLTARNLQHAIC